MTYFDMCMIAYGWALPAAYLWAMYGPFEALAFLLAVGVL